MQEMEILLKQVGVMFALMAVGYTLAKLKLLTKEGTSQINTLVLYVVNPAVMIASFNRSFSMEDLTGLLWALLLSILLMSTALAVSCLFFSKKEAMGRFCAIFNNCGFMGIPLVQALLGTSAVFYLTVLMAVWNLYSWTIGIYLLSQDRSLMSWKKILCNPAVVSTGIGLVLFFLPGSLPPACMLPLEYLGNMNTPMGMLLIGASLSTLPLARVFYNSLGWKVVFFRLLVIPLCTMAVFLLFPFIPEIRMTMMIAACTPSGATVVMFSNMLKKDSGKAASIVSLTTLVSIVTIPLMLGIAAIFWTLF